MDYDEFLKNYTPELKLLDALDYAKDRPWEAVEILNQLAFDSNNEKNAVKSDQKDLIP